MKLLTRREMLHGLGACSAFALLGPLGRAATEGLSEASAPAFTQLNVLIHGMTIIDVGNSEITLYPPVVPNSLHVYEAGNTGYEKHLAKGATYSLKGVKRNSRPSLADLHPGDNGVFHRHAIVAGDYFCRIILPFPDSIVPLGLTKILPAQPFFQGTPAPYQQPSAVADLNVFRYTVTGPVSLKPLPWIPKVKNGVANLQIFAMPSGPVPSSHPAQAFQAMADTMGYPNLKANPHYAHASDPPLDPHPPVPGVSMSDEQGLPERHAARRQTQSRPHVTVTTALDCATVFMY
jgi:hypothetical protein